MYFNGDVHTLCYERSPSQPIASQLLSQQQLFLSPITLHSIPSQGSVCLSVWINPINYYKHIKVVSINGLLALLAASLSKLAIFIISCIVYLMWKINSSSSSV